MKKSFQNPPENPPENPKGENTNSIGIDPDPFFVDLENPGDIFNTKGGIYIDFDKMNDPLVVYEKICFLFLSYEYDVVLAFISVLYKKGKIDKKSLLDIYKSQKETYSINLKGMFELNILTKDEVIKIANENYKSINIDDMGFIIHLFYKELTDFEKWSENPFSKDFISYHYKKAIGILDNRHNPYIRNKGKLASLIVIAMLKSYPEEIDISDIMKFAIELSREDSTSHGVGRLLSVGYFLLKDESEREKIPFIDNLIKVLENLLSKVQETKDFIEHYLEEYIKSEKLLKHKEYFRTELEKMIETKTKSIWGICINID